MTIILRRDKSTGKQNIIVKLDSDADALPMEHEEHHKALVEKLLGKGIKAEDLGHVIIERDADGQATVNTGETDPTEKKAVKGKS
jgi:hypothetical protein